MAVHEARTSEDLLLRLLLQVGLHQRGGGAGAVQSEAAQSGRWPIKP